MKIEIESVKLGPLVVESDLLLTFPEGIPGFPEIKRYALIPHAENSPFSWLQAFTDPELAFLITDPLIFIPEYQPKLPKEEIKALKPENLDALIVLAMVSIPPQNPNQATANLMAPVCINQKNRLGKQVILQRSKFSHQTHLFSDRS